MTYQKVVSRRALRLRLQKNSNLNPYSVISPKSNTNDLSWPRSFQLMGYSALCLSVPYTFFLVLSESPRLREYIIDYFSTGNTLVEWTRWYWGEKEKVPYSELIDKKEMGKVSLRTEVCSKIRQEQKEIKRNIDSDVTVGIISITNNDNDPEIGKIPGYLPVDDVFLIWNLLCDNCQPPIHEYNKLEVTFKDENDGITTPAFIEIDKIKNENNSLRSLINIWSAWNYFPTLTITPLNNQSKSSFFNKRSFLKDYNDTEIEMKILELEWHVSELTKELCDPNCTKNRDDMEGDLFEFRKELKLWRKRRRFGKWIKKILT